MIAPVPEIKSASSTINTCKEYVTNTLLTIAYLYVGDLFVDTPMKQFTLLSRMEFLTLSIEPLSHKKRDMLKLTLVRSGFFKH